MAEIIDIENGRFRMTPESIAGVLQLPEIYDRVPSALMREVLVDVVREILDEEADERANPRPMTLKQIARRLSEETNRPKIFTSERIRQIEARALEKCRRAAKRQGMRREVLAFFERDVKLHTGIRRIR